MHRTATVVRSQPLCNADCCWLNICWIIHRAILHYLSAKHKDWSCDAMRKAMQRVLHTTNANMPMHTISKINAFNAWEWERDGDSPPPHATVTCIFGAWKSNRLSVQLEMLWQFATEYFSKTRIYFFLNLLGMGPIQANKLASIECLKNLMSFRKQLSSIYDSL